MRSMRGTILNLKALEPLDADAGAAERGLIIHAILADFVRRFPDALPADALQKLIAIGREHFGPTLANPGVWAFWWPRFCARRVVDRRAGECAPALRGAAADGGDGRPGD